jgi:cell wall-associated NlpC family hydrolase
MPIYRHFISIFLLLCSTACAAVEPTAEPKVDTVPQAAEPAQTTSNEFINVDSSDWFGIAQEVLMNALSLTGIKYKYGGSSPETGFDCSGFVRYVFQQAASLTLPHSTRALSQLGQVIPLEQLKPGDLVFFDTLKSAFSHVGIYLGDSRFIHAPSAGGNINVVNMNDAYWAKRFNGARRLEISKTPSTEKLAN